ncbi:retrovirus-related Pol polyprotein from transposon 412 [Trichonephila clavipes]|nr:retrovirus-related Pol polyprotein from transposon 412 [Trichonephila clavipes]
MGKKFILDTDVSHESIGAMLSLEIDGQERVSPYFSKCLSKPERNYCVTRKELLAIVRAVENFYPYLYGRRSLLRIDHASLTWLLSFKNPEDQIARYRDYRSMTWKFATEKDQHMEMQTPFREHPVLRASNTAQESKKILA